MTTLTDLTLAMAENEGCPSPETELNAAQKPLSALLDNLNDTRVVVTRSHYKTKYYEAKSLLMNILELSPYSSIF